MNYPFHKINTPLILLVAFLAPMVLNAQTIDLFTASQTYAPKADFTWVDGQKQEAIEYNTLINAKVPVVLSDKVIWYSNLTYNINELKASQRNDVTSATYRLQGLILQTGVVLKLNEKTSIQALVAPRVLGEQLSINSTTLQIGGIALIEQVYSENLTMRFGVLYNQDKFGPFFVPLIYSDWKFGNGFFIKGLWPIYGKIGKQINPNLQMGISEFALITSYNLNKQAPNTYIERNSIDFAYFVRYRVFGNWHIEPRVGITMSRGYDQYQNNDQLAGKISAFSIEDSPRTLLNGSLASAPFVNFRLVYSLPIED